MKLKKILPWPPQYCTRVLYSIPYYYHIALQQFLTLHELFLSFIRITFLVGKNHCDYPGILKNGWPFTRFYTMTIWQIWPKLAAFHTHNTVLPESKVMPARCDAMRDVWQNSEHFTLLSCGESARFQNKIITNGSFLGGSTQYVAKLGMHWKLIWSAIAGVGKLRDCKFKLLVKIIFVNNNNK